MKILIDQKISSSNFFTWEIPMFYLEIDVGTYLLSGERIFRCPFTLIPPQNSSSR